MGIFNAINGVFWGNFMVYVLVGSAIIFTLILKFPQVRRFGDSVRMTFGNLKSGGKATKEGMSSWQSLLTAVAGQVGAGNIAGPATAIIAGGPGAVFWLWVSAFFGMGTIFAEATGAQRYKTILPDGSVTGGPAYYIQAAFPNAFGKFLAGAFSIFIIVGFGIAAAMIQGNTIADAMKTSFGIPLLVTGAIVAILLFLIVVGGIGRIAGTVTKLVPFMALLYIVAALIAIFINIQHVPTAFAMIFKGAFTAHAATGAFVGIGVREAIRYGVARGLFSNEAGMGSTPHAHAVARVKHPCDQGLVAMMSVVIDSFIILTISCLLILSSAAYESGHAGVGVVQSAFQSVFGGFGSILLAICIFCFCFSTIIAAYFYGEGNFKRLFGVKSTFIYIGLILFFVIFGSIAPVPLVWAICDTFNGLMVFTNLIGLFGVSGVIAKLWKEYEQGGKDMDTTLNDIKVLRAAQKAGQK